MKFLVGAVVILVGLAAGVMVVAIVSISLLDRTNGTLVSSGEEREYLLYVPASYDGARPTDPVESVAGPEIKRIEYMDCAEGAPVVLYAIEGGGHTWPGGKPLPEWWVGSTSDSIDATRRMWAFFREHRLRGAQIAAQRG